MNYGHPQLLYLAQVIVKQATQMSSAAKIAANRENARKSTGPRSGLGKSNSRLNALKFGIHATAPVLPGEDVDAFRDLQKSNLEYFAPVGPAENLLVYEMTTTHWRMERIQRAENALYARLNEGQVVRFLGSLGDKETAYVNSTYADELREEIRQARNERRAKNALLRLELWSKLPPGKSIPEAPQKSDEEVKDDVEVRLGRILDPDNTLLEVLVPTSEKAPQNYLVQERRSAMRTYMAYSDKLKELQEARMTVTLSSQPQIAGTAQKRADAKRPQPFADKAANQNQLTPENEVPEK